MKKPEQTTKRGTTNYPFDPHKNFCKRCLQYHGHCPKGMKGGMDCKHKGPDAHEHCQGRKCDTSLV